MNTLRLRPWSPRIIRHFSWHSPYNLNTRSYSSTQQIPRLNNRTCMITGGSSGIGYAIAERFLAENAARVILVGRSTERLLEAGRRLQLQSQSQTSLHQEQPNGDVATRAPEEDQDRPTGESTGKKQNGDVLRPYERISLLVGDVGEAGSWMRELEREMVFLPFSSHSFPLQKLMDSTGISRHPNKRSGHLRLRSPPQNRPIRYNQHTTNEPRRRNSNLPCPPARINAVSSPQSQIHWRLVRPDEMHHQCILAPRRERRDGRCSVRGE